MRAENVIHSCHQDFPCLGRLGMLADFGGPAVFLASAPSGYVTGAILTVAGGLILAS